MEHLNFKEVNKLVNALAALDMGLTGMFEAKAVEERRIQELCRELLMEDARESLSSISVEELKNSRAGIRVSALMDAGYKDLRQLDLAPDWQLAAVDGIGEKQVASIRNIIKEFVSRLSEYGTIRLPADDYEEASKNSRELILSIAKHRQGELIRRDSEALSGEIHDFAQRILTAGLIKSRLKWVFSGKAAKEQTVLAAGELVSFFNSKPYLRASRLLSLYKEASEMGEESAMADYKQNAAAYYALMESLGGRGADKALIYDSIPAQLADAVDAFPLNESAFQGNLRAYQAFGAKYILFQKRVLLGDEMGLGKTIQAIAAMAHLHAEQEDAHFLVVCPASVLINWCREIQKFSPVKAHLIHGAGMEASFFSWQQEGGAGVTNFETMGRIVDRIDNHMRLMLLIIDEAHYIKNPEAKRTKYIHLLNNESERILMMTGTPLENRVEEMCALIDFIRPDMSNRIRGAATMSHVPQFREMLAPVYLRRLREMVLKELPPIEEEMQWCLMTSEDLKYYIEAVQERNFTKMRRVSFLGQELLASSKAMRLKELCEQGKAEGRKIIVYSFFRETIGKVAELLGQDCHGLITGDTPIGDRQAIIDRFAQAQDGSVLVCQVQAGGTGLNIQSASIVIFCEPQIKPSLEAQAISRVYRMGQVRNVLVYRLLCEGSVDEAMMRILSEKQAEFDAFADESAMAEATENILDREWIQSFIEMENKKYLPMVIEQQAPEALKPLIISDGIIS